MSTALTACGWLSDILRRETVYVLASPIPAMVDRFRGRHFGVIFGVTQIGSSIGSEPGA